MMRIQSTLNISDNLKKTILYLSVLFEVYFISHVLKILPVDYYYFFKETFFSIFAL